MTKYEDSQFGDGVSTTRVQVVHNTYGARGVGGSTGVEKVSGSTELLRLQITGEDLNDLLEPLVPTYLPAGAVIRDVWWDTQVAFNLTGTSPTILVGTDTTEVTNGLVISEAVAESTNTARLTSTLTGTWAVNTPIQARTKIGFALGGTSPVVARTGKGILTIEYSRPNLGV